MAGHTPRGSVGASVQHACAGGLFSTSPAASCTSSSRSSGSFRSSTNRAASSTTCQQLGFQCSGSKQRAGTCCRCGRCTSNAAESGRCGHHHQQQQQQRALQGVVAAVLHQGRCWPTLWRPRHEQQQCKRAQLATYDLAATSRQHKQQHGQGRSRQCG